jgi:hypothetical protein
MPPAMQLKQETPRHANGSLKCRQTLTDELIDAPEDEAGDSEHATPVDKSTDFTTDGFVGDAMTDYGAGFESYA